METVIGHELEIRDGTAFLVEKRIVKQASLSTLLAETSKHVKQSFTCTPLMPAKDGTCRLYATCGNYAGFLMQCNPMIREINYENRGRGGREKKYRVSLPWIWVLCKFSIEKNDMYRWNSCYLCATYKNLQTLQDPVFLAPLPNQYNQGMSRMCTGSALTHAGAPTKAPGLICMQWLSQLFNSVFNDDLTVNFPGWMHATWDRNGNVSYFKQCFTTWEKKTAENPSIGLSPEMGLLTYSKGVGGLEGFLRHALGENQQ